MRGRSWNGGDAGRRVVVPYIRRLGATSVHSYSVILTMITWEARQFVAGHSALSGGNRLTLERRPPIESALAAVQAEQIPWRRVHPATRCGVDGVLVKVLAPDSAWTVQQPRSQSASVVVAVNTERRAGFTGDAELEEESWLIQRWGNELRSSVLKSGHQWKQDLTVHLPRSSIVPPPSAIISVGAEKHYGHPSPSSSPNTIARHSHVSHRP